MSSKPISAPGATWRILAKAGDQEIELRDQGIFDELVIDDWLHLEQMDDRTYWMRVGDACVTIVIDASGRPTVTIGRNVYATGG